MIRKILIWSAVAIAFAVLFNKIFVSQPKIKNAKPSGSDTISASIDTAIFDGENSEELRALKSIEVDESKFKLLIKNARKSKDEFQDSKWIHDVSTTTYTNRKAVYIYIGQSEVTTWLRFRLQYTASDWLFIDNAIFNIDGKNFNYSPAKVDRDNSGGEIWEWWDETVTGSDLSMLVAIANAKSSKVKLNGTTYYNVQSISQKERKAIHNILKIYKGILLGYK